MAESLSMMLHLQDLDLGYVSASAKDVWTQTKQKTVSFCGSPSLLLAAWPFQSISEKVHHHVIALICCLHMCCLSGWVVMRDWQEQRSWGGGCCLDSSAPLQMHVPQDPKSLVPKRPISSSTPSLSYVTHPEFSYTPVSKHWF